MTHFNTFDNYKALDQSEKDKVKAVHRGLRTETSSRAGNLAWGFARGFPYRRIERTTRTQVIDGKVFNHNPPNLLAIARILAEHIPGLDYFASPHQLRSDCPLITWAASLDGAIPAPVRVKKPFVRPTENVA